MKSFASFRLDAPNHCLLRDQERVAIAPKAFDVLRYLVENPGRLVTQDELLDAVWPDTHVNPEILRKYILDIRKLLGDRADRPLFIETVTKRGYRFIAAVSEEPVPEQANPSLSSPAVVTQQEEKVPVQATLSDRKLAHQKFKSGLVLLVALLVAGVAAATYFRFTRKSGSPSPVKNTSIAVLPFVDLSPSKDQEYFSDGLTEELINDLAKVPGLKVVSRSSVFQFKGKNEDLRSVGQRLGVANVLEGTVRREGNRVRITAELTKAGDGFQLWSQTYDREISHIIATQDEIAHAVTGALQARLLTSLSEENSGSTNPEAYELYLQGQYFRARGQDREDLEKALSYADQAIKLDPDYAPAWAQRAYLLDRLAGLALIDSPEGFRQARESAQKAIAIGPDLAAGYLVLGLIQIDHDWDWQGADASLRKAGELEPGNSDVLNDRAYLAKSTGRVDEASALYPQAIALDPLRANSHLGFGHVLYMAGRYEKAESEFQRAQELNPQLSSLHLARAQTLLAKGHPDEALAEIENETGEWQKLLGETLAYHALGRRAESDQALSTLVARHQNDCAYQIAQAYAFRGEIDRAFQWMDRAIRQRDPGAPVLPADPLMNNLHSDPRYSTLLAQIGLRQN